MLNIRRINVPQLLAIVALVLAVLLGALNARAQESSGTTTPATTEECKVFNDAASNAMKNHLSLIDRFMLSAEKSMQKAIQNSCISALARLNFDLSSLIPDFNIFGVVLDRAIQAFATFLTNKVCDVVSNTVGDWNNIVAGLALNWNFNSAIERWGDDVINSFVGGSGGSGISGSGGGSTSIVTPGPGGRQCV